MYMKKTIIALIVLVLVGGIGAYLWSKRASNTVVAVNPPTPVVTPTTTAPEEVAPVKATPTTTPVNKTETVIGKSVEGNSITAYHYGSGAKEVLFVGGIHGGYEWNTVLVAYELMDYLKANPKVVPVGVKVTVIPVLNPDGLNKTVGTTGRFTKADVPTPIEKTTPGRYNANKVDLNRNFDCNWKTMGLWNKVPVSGGASAFSEPESKVFKSYIETSKPSAVVAWFSAAGGVYSSSCSGAVSPVTAELTKAYADASGYPAYKEYDYYEISGDVANWLAKVNVPAISVLLTTHDDTEWSKNEAGVKALLAHVAK